MGKSNKLLTKIDKLEEENKELSRNLMIAKKEIGFDFDLDPFRGKK